MRSRIIQKARGQATVLVLQGICALRNLFRLQTATALGFTLGLEPLTLVAKMQQLHIPLRKPPSLRNNNGAVQLRVRINGTDAFINRLGKWSDHTAVAKASALSARIWADYCSGTFDSSLRTYLASGDREDTELLSALKTLAESSHQGRTIHAYRTLQKYGKTIRIKEDIRTEPLLASCVNAVGSCPNLSPCSPTNSKFPKPQFTVMFWEQKTSKRFWSTSK